jgi:hypothetical protein
MPSIAFAGTGTGASVLAVAARQLGWELAESEPGADIVVVDTRADIRGSRVVALLESGVHVIVSPGLGIGPAELVVEAARRSQASLVMAEIFPMAPAMQRWFAELQRLDEVTHLSGQGGAASADWSLLTMTVLSARLAGWGDPVDAALDGHLAILRFTSSASTARLSIDVAQDGSTAQWELQAASSTNALRIEMVPRPRMERNGEPLAVPGGNDPPEMFGATPLLRTFWSDIAAGRRPVLGAQFLLTIERLGHQLIRAR